MKSIQCVFFACLVNTLLVGGIPASAQELTEGDPAVSIEILQSDAPLFDKAKACQRLAILGDEAAVPALAELLDDPVLTGYARYGLEGIPGEAATTALREALPTLEGEALIGLIGSVGKRRDAEAIPLIADRLNDPATRSAAAFALGEIGTAQCATLLSEALAAEPAGTTRGVLRCAQRRAEEGDRDNAQALYEELIAADVNRHTELAAIQGLILLGGPQSESLFREQLTGDAIDAFRMALTAIRNGSITLNDELVPPLETLPDERQALMIIALRDYGDPALVPMIIDAARTGSEEVQVQAALTAAEFQDTAALPLLWELAAAPNDRIAQAGREAIAAYETAGTEERIVRLLGSESVQEQRLAIDLAKRRNLEAATEQLMEIAKKRDSAVRMEAIDALGATVGLNHFPDLLELALDSTDPQVKSAAQAAVIDATARIPKADCASILARKLPAANGADQGFLLERLAQLGGTRALEAVVVAAESDDPELQDAATRVLGEWPSAEAAPALRELAQSLDSQRFRIRAIRGYIRIARQLDMTLEERMEVCQNALQLASRDVEKQLVLDVLQRHRSPAGIEVAMPLLDDPDLREKAATVIVTLADEFISESPRAIVPALEKVIEVTNRNALRDEAQALLKRAT